MRMSLRNQNGQMVWKSKLLKEWGPQRSEFRGAIDGLSGEIEVLTTFRRIQCGLGWLLFSVFFS